VIDSPDVDEIAARSDPDKDIVVIPLHSLEDGFAHTQSLFIDAFARCVTIALRKLGDVMSADRRFYAVKSFSPFFYSVFPVHVRWAGSKLLCDSPSPQQTGELEAVNRS
jgi:hypothetical protein